LPVQVLLKLFRVQLLAASGDVSSALEAAQECAARLGQDVSALPARDALFSQQLQLHCLLLQTLMQLATGDTGALQRTGRIHIQHHFYSVQKYGIEDLP
jgi:hypothetical protein